MSSPRSARETCRASTSSSAPPAPIRRRNVPTASPFLDVTTPRPRRSRHEAGSPKSASRAARPAPRRDDHELEVRPAAGQAERATGEEPAAQPRGMAVVGGRVPGERRRAPGACSSPDRRRGGRPAGDAPRGQASGRAPPLPPCGRRPARGRWRPARPRSAVTRSRSDRVTSRRPARRSGRRCDGRFRPRARGPADDRRREPAGSWWCALSGSTTSSRISRGTGSTTVASAARPAGRTCRPGSGRRVVVGEHDVDEAGLRVGDERLDMVGQVEAGRLALLRRHVADEDARRRRRAPRRRGWPGSAGSAAGSCTGCPDRGR